jgi:hypothetical protein
MEVTPSGIVVRVEALNRRVPYLLLVALFTASLQEPPGMECGSRAGELSSKPGLSESEIFFFRSWKLSC